MPKLLPFWWTHMTHMTQLRTSTNTPKTICSTQKSGEKKRSLALHATINFAVSSSFRSWLQPCFATCSWSWWRWGNNDKGVQQTNHFPIESSTLQPTEETNAQRQALKFKVSLGGSRKGWNLLTTEVCLTKKWNETNGMGTSRRGCRVETREPSESKRLWVKWYKVHYVSANPTNSSNFHRPTWNTYKP